VAVIDFFFTLWKVILLSGVPVPTAWRVLGVMWTGLVWLRIGTGGELL
jgi:hypothetical protein